MEKRPHDVVGANFASIRVYGGQMNKVGKRCPWGRFVG